MPNDTCYILALIKRDDGERLLLGSGFYQFTKEQKHFNPNVYANDIVELQGADGQLLAGQVRRSSAQSFDGYIGDGTTSKDAVEQKRREFFLFFRKQHHYTVVYIMPDGTAIKRDRGYIVDAPAVQELYQVQPKWHIALAFEDVNYYSYAEDALGNEIYSFTQMLGLANVVDGGLIWDSAGAVSEAQKGIFLGIKGDTYQAQYTGKNVFPVNNISNNVSVTVNNDGSITVAGTTSSSLDLNANLFELNRVTNGATYSFWYEGDTLPAGAEFRAGLYNGSTWVRHLLGSGKVLTSSTKSLTGTSNTTNADRLRGQLHLAANTTINATFKVQLEKSASPTTFEKYVGGAPAPSPDYPQQIQTVTGEQTITVNGTTYTLTLQNEFNQFGGYQDRIYLDGTSWKIEKQTTSVVLDGSADENWSSTGTGVYATAANGDIGIGNVPVGLCNYAIFNPVQTSVTGTLADGEFAIQRNNPGKGRFFFKNTAQADVTAFKAWLATNKPKVVYNLATPTIQTITNAGVIAALDAIKEAIDEYGSATVSASSPNLPAILGLTPNTDTGGYVWAPSSGGGPVTVTVDGVDSANPVWHVFGACSNPTLTNSTTGQALTWNGDVPAGQELIIDMGAQTATLEGANVFEFVSGSWIQLAPGTNRVSYTAANTTQDSKLEWNEIVG